MELGSAEEIFYFNGCRSDLTACYMPQPDFWSWNYEKTCIFSVRSDYKMIVETREGWLDGSTESSCIDKTKTQGQWEKLWKTKVPAKLRIFAWRLARSSLLGKSTPSDDHYGSPALSVGATLDSWRHSLLDCNMAQEVLSREEDEVFEHLLADCADDPKLQLMSLCDNLSQASFIRVLTTLWAVW
jgi:hypothetical protein